MECNSAKRVLMSAGIRGRRWSALATRHYLSSQRHAESPRPSMDVFRSANVLYTSHSVSNRFLSSSSKPKIATFRSLLRPFLLKCHPDTSVPSARGTNLQAVQAVNGLVDALERVLEGNKSAAGSVALPNLVTIRFVVANPTEPAGKQKKKGLLSASLRSVELTFSDYRDDVLYLQQETSAGDHSEWTRRHNRLKAHAREQFCKVLTVAGLPTPSRPSLYNDDSETGGSGRSRSDIQDEILFDEMGFESDGAQTGMGGARNTDRIRERMKKDQQTPFQKSRQDFMKRIDWKRFKKEYDEVMSDAEADYMTRDAIKRNAERRAHLVSSICSRICVAPPAASSRSVIPANTLEALLRGHQEEEGLGVAQQLIAIRRITLLLEDNFDDLSLEEMGNFWEHLKIVLTPERRPAMALGGRKPRAKDSGFQFHHHANDTVSIHVPVDFRDDEFVNEMNRNVWDFYAVTQNKYNSPSHILPFL